MNKCATACPSDSGHRKDPLGYDSDEQFEEILDALSGVALSEITIHARTKDRAIAPAHWHQLGKHAVLPYPVIANGELWNLPMLHVAPRSAAAMLSCSPGRACRPDLGAAIVATHRGEVGPTFSWPEAQQLLVTFLARNGRFTTSATRSIR